MKTKIISATGILALGVVLPAIGAEANDGKFSAKDQSFINAAAKGGQMEVDWGTVAAENGQNGDVKKFGNRMAADHAQANDELKVIAGRQGLSLPKSTEAPAWKSDKAYMQMMVKDHEIDLTEFQEEAKNGSDPDLKNFAEKTSRLISQHLVMAREIGSKLK